MFRPMRRSRQQLSDEESIRILRECSFGVLSLPGENGYPYGVPMNYVYAEGALYFHGAATGLRRDAVGEGCKVSFTVVEKWDVDAAALTSHYRSVILFGHFRPLPKGEESEKAALLLGLRFLDDEKAVREEVEREKKALRCYVLEIESMSGKEGKTLAERRRENHA